MPRILPLRTGVLWLRVEFNLFYAMIDKSVIMLETRDGLQNYRVQALVFVSLVETPGTHTGSLNTGVCTRAENCSYLLMTDCL